MEEVEVEGLVNVSCSCVVRGVGYGSMGMEIERKGVSRLAVGGWLIAEEETETKLLA